MPGFRLKFLLFSLVLCWSGVFARAQSPLAGDIISNRASVSFLIGEQSVTFDSNEVRVGVLPQEDLLLTADNEVRFPPGSSAVLPHRLTNTGNVATEYLLALTNLAGDGYDLANLRLFRDANGNGLLDSGESEISAASRIALEPWL